MSDAHLGALANYIMCQNNKTSYTMIHELVYYAHCWSIIYGRTDSGLIQNNITTTFGEPYIADLVPCIKILSNITEERSHFLKKIHEVTLSTFEISILDLVINLYGDKRFSWFWGAHKQPGEPCAVLYKYTNINGGIVSPPLTADIVRIYFSQMTMKQHAQMEF